MPTNVYGGIIKDLERDIARLEEKRKGYKEAVENWQKNLNAVESDILLLKNKKKLLEGANDGN